MTTTRRTFLGSLAFAIFGTAGCLGANSGGTTDITVSNETSRMVTASLRVTRQSDDARLLEDTVSLDENEGEEYDEVVGGSRVEVRLSIADGPEDTYEWSDGESDASGLHIDVESNSIAFSPFVR